MMLRGWRYPPLGKRTRIPVVTGASALEPATIACDAGRRSLEISAPISQLPLALIPTATVPLLLVLHITSTSALVRAPQTPLPATAPLTAAPK